MNPLLQNGITNRDIFRTLLIDYKEDNFIPINKSAMFVVNLLKRPKHACDGHNEKVDEETLR